MHFEAAQPFAAIHGQDAMRGHAFQRLFLVLVHKETVRPLCVFYELGGQRTDAPQFLAQCLAKRCVLGDDFGANIPRTGKRLFRSLHAFLRIHKRFRKGNSIALSFLLGHHGFSQRQEALLLGLRRTGGPLLFIGKVEVFELLQLLGCFDLLSKLVGQFSLLFDFGKDFLLALGEIAKVSEPLLDGADLFVHQRARHLLAVAGNEWHGISFVQKADGLLHLLRTDGKLFRDELGDVGDVHGIWSPLKIG